MHLRRKILSPYHYLWALGSALYYRFPARRLTVIAITGTKGKSSVAEMLYSVLSASGHKTALAGTIRFAVGEESRPNLYKMTLPGRGFIQQFLAEAVEAGCTHAVIEITSEAALQYRHLFLELDALIFTNLEPEHIESHGSLEKYFRAKYKIGEALASSRKRPRAIIANEESEYGRRFLELSVEDKLPYAYTDAEDPDISDVSVAFTYLNVRYTLPQPGAFSVMNALAVIRAAQWLGVEPLDIKSALLAIRNIPGRAERIEAGQPFDVVIDYAHTPGSLVALYEAFKDTRKICVLGNTGGGRDTWKRPLMGKIASEYCDEVILTNEDPYDEDPQKIVDAMASGMTVRKPRSILDRRAAIHEALRLAMLAQGDAQPVAVLITGKGTDPYIMGSKNSKLPWSDARVAREELEKLVA